MPCPCSSPQGLTLVTALQRPRLEERYSQEPPWPDGVAFSSSGLYFRAILAPGQTAAPRGRSLEKAQGVQALLRAFLTLWLACPPLGDHARPSRPNSWTPHTASMSRRGWTLGTGAVKLLAQVHSWKARAAASSWTSSCTGQESTENQTNSWKHKTAKSESQRNRKLA